MVEVNVQEFKSPTFGKTYAAIGAESVGLGTGKQLSDLVLV